MQKKQKQRAWAIGFGKSVEIRLAAIRPKEVISSFIVKSKKPVNHRDGSVGERTVKSEYKSTVFEGGEVIATINTDQFYQYCWEWAPGKDTMKEIPLDTAKRLAKINWWR